MEPCGEPRRVALHAGHPHERDRALRPLHARARRHGEARQLAGVHAVLGGRDREPQLRARQLHPDHQTVWIMGDDHVWDSSVLMDMLAIMDENPEVDILVPLVVKRNPPWHPVIVQSLGQVSDEGIPMFETVKWEDIPEKGLLEIDAAGSAGMLIAGSWTSSSPLVLPPLHERTHRPAQRGLHLLHVRQVHRSAHLRYGRRGHRTPGVFNVRPLYRNGQWGALTEFSTPMEQFRHMLLPVEYVMAGEDA